MSGAADFTVVFAVFNVEYAACLKRGGVFLGHKPADDAADTGLECGSGYGGVVDAAVYIDFKVSALFEAEVSYYTAALSECRCRIVENLTVCGAVNNVDFAADSGNESFNTVRSDDTDKTGCSAG